MRLQELDLTCSDPLLARELAPGDRVGRDIVICVLDVLVLEVWMPDVVDPFIFHSVEELIGHRGQPEVAPELTVTEYAEADVALQLQGSEDACVLDFGELGRANAATAIVETCRAQLL